MVVCLINLDEIIAIHRPSSQSKPSRNAMEGISRAQHDSLRLFGVSPRAHGRV